MNNEDSTSNVQPATTAIMGDNNAQNSVQSQIQNSVEFLKPLSIYSQSGLKKMKVVITLLRANRSINDSAVIAKVRSITKCGGVISPCLIVPAKKCLEEHLEVTMIDGTEVTEATPDLDKIYVLIDGQHRYSAIEKYNKERKDGETKAECYFHLPLNIDYAINTILSEVNVATKAWSNKDHLHFLGETRKNTGERSESLKWVVDIAKKGSEKAAWKWYRLDDKRVPTKNKLAKAVTDENDFNEIMKSGKFIHGKRLYETLSEHAEFDDKFLGNDVVPTFFIEKINRKQECNERLEDIINDLVEFIQGMSSRDTKEIKGYKADKDGLNKAQKIEAKLYSLYQSYETAKITNTTLQ